MNYLNPSETSLTQRFHLKVPSLGFKKSSQFEIGIKSCRSKMPIIRLVKVDTQGIFVYINSECCFYDQSWKL